MSHIRKHPVSEKPFVWVDTETTGLIPEDNEIIEIAIVRPMDNGSELVFHRKVRLEKPETAHPKALEVNGYSEDAWADAVGQADIWQEIADRQLLSNCILAGHNVRYDAAMLAASFKRHGIDYTVDYHLYDTVTLALEHLQPLVKCVSLVPVCVALGIPVSNAHSALADVRMAQEVSRILRGAQIGPSMEEMIKSRLAAWEEAGRPDEWGVSS